MGWIDFVILAVIGLSIWSGYRGGMIRSTVLLVGLIVGVEFASRNFQRFAKELAPMVHSLDAANAIWFLLQVFIVVVAFGFVGHAIQHELSSHHLVEWLGTSIVDGIGGGLLGLARGVLLSAICIMAVAAFFPGTDTLSDAFLPKYLAGTTAVLSNLTSYGMQRKIVIGIESMDPDVTAPDTNQPDAIPSTTQNP